MRLSPKEMASGRPREGSVQKMFSERLQGSPGSSIPAWVFAGERYRPFLLTMAWHCMLVPFRTASDPCESFTVVKTCSLSCLMNSLAVLKVDFGGQRRWNLRSTSCTMDVGLDFTNGVLRAV